MFKYAQLILGKWIFRINSKIIGYILKWKHISVGKELYIEGVPRLKINGKPENIIIGDSVEILGDIDLRNRENGRIFLHDGCKIENGCRFVAAQEGSIEVGENSVVATRAIINGGGSVIVGSNTVIAANCSINANDHLARRDELIRNQGFVYGDVIIGNDCWVGANVCINKDVTIGDGAVIGAGAVVTKDVEPYSINAGVPAVKIGERK